MKTNLMDNIAKLNDKQREAVLATQGPVLIAAGAGSGKTRVLTHRIAYLIEEEQVNPWNILAITFTNKAAREMKERVHKLVGPEAESIWIATFHAMCARILRRECERLGYKRNFSIIDTGEQQTLMKQVLKELNMDSNQFNYKDLLAAIDEAKNSGLDPKAFSQEAVGYFGDIQAKVYDYYQRKLFDNNVMDFNDLIMLTVKLLKDHEDIRQFYQEKFQYIHVDEYQDTNDSQYQLIQLLAGNLKNVCVVGDSDQSIYGWRGANMENILNFEKDFPQAQVILLEQNYRSTKNILKAANSVIRNNQKRKPKELWSDKEEGAKVKYYQAETDLEEARFVIQQILELKDKYRASHSDFAVLYRTQAQSRSLEDQFLRANLAYKVVGGLKFYARKEIQDTLAYLRLIDNGIDNLSFQRIINVPKRGLGQASIEKLGEFAESLSLSLFDAIGQIEHSNIPHRTQNKFISFYQMILRLRQQAEFLNLSELVTQVWEQTDYINDLRSEGSIEAQNRIENLEEFESVTKQFDQANQDFTETDPDFLKQDGLNQGPQDLEPRQKLTYFLSELSLTTDTEEEEENPDQVTLMTLHAAKGLEFPFVFIVGLEEGLFPLRRASEDEEELEEERRLAYVGMTRAEQILYLTASRSRLLYGRYQQNIPSRFIDEIDSAYLDSSLNGIRSIRRNQEILSGPQAPTRTQVNRVILSSQRPSQRRSKIQPTENLQDFKEGDKVDHKAWGLGVVKKVVQSGGDQLLSIDFPSQGLKQVLAKFAPIKKIE